MPQNQKKKINTHSVKAIEEIENQYYDTVEVRNVSDISAEQQQMSNEIKESADSKTCEVKDEELYYEL